MFSHLALLALPVLGLTTAVSAQSTAYNRAACASSFVEVSPGVPSGQFYTDDTTLYTSTWTFNPDVCDPRILASTRELQRQQSTWWGGMAWYNVDSAARAGTPNFLDSHTVQYDFGVTYSQFSWRQSTMRVRITLFATSNDWSEVTSAPFSVDMVEPPAGVNRCAATIAQTSLSPSFQSDDETILVIPGKINVYSLCEDQLVRGWKLDRLIGGDVANREAVASVEWSEKTPYVANTANVFSMTFPTVTHSSLISGETYGIYVVLTDDTGYSKTQLSTLFTPTISSNAVANLKNCVGSIRATLQSQYSFTTDDTTGFFSEFTYDTNLCMPSHFVSSRALFRPLLNGRNRGGIMWATPTLGSAGSGTFTMRWPNPNGWFHDYDSDADLATIYSIQISLQDPQSIPSSETFDSQTFAIVNSGPTTGNCMASITSHPVVVPNTFDPAATSFQTTFHYDPSVCFSTYFQGCFITVNNPANMDFFSARQVGYGNNPVLDGAGAGTCTFPITANQFDKTTTYDLRARVDNAGRPGRYYSRSNQFPVFGQIGDFPAAAAELCASSLVSPTADAGSGGSSTVDIGFAVNANLCAMTMLNQPDASGVYAYLYTVDGSTRTLVARATTEPTITNGQLKFVFVILGGMKRRDLFIRAAATQYEIEVPNGGDPLVVRFTEPNSDQPIIAALPEISPGVKNRRAVAAGLMIPSDIDCLPSQKACAVPGRKAVWECVDVLSDINACGGCPDDPTAVDCTGLEAVDAVACNLGRCQVNSCSDGYAPAGNSSMCLSL